MKNKLLMTAAFAVAAAVTSQAALVAYWDFEGDTQEANSSTVGTLTGDAAVGGTAIAPSGSGSLTTTTGNFDSTMNADAVAGFGGTGSFSVLSWVQTSSATDQTVFSYSPYSGTSAGAGKELRYFIQDDGNFRVEMTSGAGFEVTGNLNDGATHMVGVVFDSATGDSFRDLVLYIDGTLYPVTGGTDHTVNLTGTGNTIRFGANTGAGPRQFVGTIDDVGIFDTALSSAELATFAVSGIPEPATLGMIAVMGGGLLFIRRRLMM